MLSTSAHMMLTLTSLATILKLIGAPLRGILPAAAPATLADMLIDLGHTGSGRSAATHSIITAPIIALIAYMPAATLAYIAGPLLEALGLDAATLLTLMLWGCLYAAALHDSERRVTLIYRGEALTVSASWAGNRTRGVKAYLPSRIVHLLIGFKPRPSRALLEAHDGAIEILGVGWRCRICGRFTTSPPTSCAGATGSRARGYVKDAGEG